MVASALIAAGGSLLGGLFGRSRRFLRATTLIRMFRASCGRPRNTASTRSPSSARCRRWAGIPADNSALGQGVANAALIASDAVSAKRQTAARLNAYQTQNARLQKRLEALTIRSPVPGVYGLARQPSDPEVYGGTGSEGGSAHVSGDGGASGAAAAAASAGLPPLLTVDPGDPRREVEPAN